MKENIKKIMERQEEPLFRPGENCWRVERATYASMVVGVANYYRDLHESICKAKHSVFIVGWDMDSRIALVRGEKAQEDGCPRTLYDLIVGKAKENPDLQIYLNKWDNSLVFSGDREFMPAVKWRDAGCPNIHFRFDGTVPVHGSHHQKLIIVDDEVAYTGGIDIGLYRWDTREHRPEHSDRIDPTTKFEPGKERPFLPNHDIQICLAGPAAQALAELARQRWKIAAGYDAIPMRPYEAKGIPNTWPDTDPPDFEDVDVAVALTYPQIAHNPPIRHVEQLYVDQIAKAENFIYIENQYLASKRIASALNNRLKLNPDLRVLLFSSRDPAGLIEESTMWWARVKFRKILQRGGDDIKRRSEMTYCITTDGERTLPVHVHAKIMIVDDKYLRVGSSNLNNRSMMLDTECDVVLEGVTEEARAKIADIRNDLIREHSGMEKADIQKLIDEKRPMSDFLIDVPHSTQHLRKIRDSLSTASSYIRALTGIGEPKVPSLPALLRSLSKHDDVAGFPHGKVSSVFLAMMMLIFLVLYWNSTPAADFVTAETLQSQIQSLRDSPYALPLVIMIFVFGGFVFVPVTVMIAATAMAFGPLVGLGLALAGAMTSAFLTFMVGYFVGERVFQNITNTAFQRVSNRVRQSGVIGVAAIRMIPIAPFTLVNMILGVSTVKLVPYLLGTLLGLLPGTIAMVLLGDSLARIWQSPDPQHLLYLGGAVVMWILVVAGVHWLVERQQEKSAGVYI